MNLVGHTVMLPIDEYEEMKLGNARYEFVRTLSPQQFAKLWERGMREDIRWDDLIDLERRNQAIAAKEAIFKFDRTLPKRRRAPKGTTA
jgi:hypothetical protein